MLSAAVDAVRRRRDKTFRGDGRGGDRRGDRCALPTTGLTTGPTTGPFKVPDGQTPLVGGLASGGLISGNFRSELIQVPLERF